MNVLMVRPKPYEGPEMSEYFHSVKCKVFSTNCPREVCPMLNELSIDQVFFNMENLEEFTIIRYINEHFPQIRVVVILESSLNNAIENVRCGDYETIQRPFHLHELMSCQVCCGKRSLLLPTNQTGI